MNLEDLIPIISLRHLKGIVVPMAISAIALSAVYHDYRTNLDRLENHKNDYGYVSSVNLALDMSKNPNPIVNTIRFGELVAAHSYLMDLMNEEEQKIKQLKHLKEIKGFAIM